MRKVLVVLLNLVLAIILLGFAFSFLANGALDCRFDGFTFRYQCPDSISQFFADFLHLIVIYTNFFWLFFLPLTMLIVLFDFYLLFKWRRTRRPKQI